MDPNNVRGITIMVTNDARFACNKYEILKYAGTPASLWCRSLSHRYICIVAVQHSHSGKISFRKF